MEKALRNILSLINIKIQNFIKELNAKMSLLQNIINSKIKEIESMKYNNNNIDSKEFYKIKEIEKNIQLILSKEDKNDIIMNANQIIQIFEIIENNEPFNNQENYTYIINTKENDLLLRMDQKNIISKIYARILCLCSMEEKDNIYNKLCLGLNNGKIYIFELETATKLLEIPPSSNYHEIIDIYDFKEGIIGVADGYSNILIYRIKEEIIFKNGDNKEISDIKVSFELIQKILPRNKNNRYTRHHIISLKPKKNKYISGDYINEFIVQSGWDNINVYIKKNNNLYYFYKEINISSRINSLLEFDESNYFFAHDYFSECMYIVSSITMEIVTIIKEKVNIREICLRPFGKLNSNIFIFLGSERIYIYSIKELQLIQEIILDDKYKTKDIILSKNNTLLISFIKNNKEYDIIEYEFIPDKKKLKEKNKYNFKNFELNKFKENYFIFSNNRRGKGHLIILEGDDKIYLFK